ncbi:TonB-dependent hemoglobin/transferrin/lactoferrin family receptor [Pasteurella skyensis]|uniref:TonB-dependent hemoglobin/transferrin/lactoferrin family receptor n=1 Tax=Phocoenobacter skyensis TaxID=97481 RepID=A0AAJ6N9G1_9PAST|nr:TonB-dependent hemoglobin/transferrin/lactoferrin family receptor [Pasteurella skyensis]MDP8162223.1 TonB-dependent hemoglobin/transferrin/lactoferrin family receptor [Pasteurella skyensis]MDP8172687.1 TonB-dependent hemoglobin/transferrin/lactoferrin family receptor [Pasteurella skyensis]MDP8179187.1 TonB-dependent hemoglobin/transferrin/lactoferrin family receptor [Pasteurella skyensis]MDP8183358.1 TonB-dependent hemoglobin/transferrin/lactoferrin family receptor [Pasteurella skyensis]MDP
MLQEKNSGGVAKFFCYSLLSLSITNALAEEATLGTINVIDSPESIQNKKVGETIKTDKTLEKQQISNTRDLVKYETGISVVEKGRMGASGYAVRGVEENRVNITIDGLQQAQTLSSQGFKELFEGYGNFNNTRNGIEVETVKQVNLAKGSDSTKVGSGALGGAVIFKTKDARDLLIGKDFYYKFKAGYASANNENMFSHTLAGRYKDFDALFIRTDRDGTNFENFGHDKFDDNVQGRSRQKVDPYTIEKASTLLKLGYNLNENNRFTVMYDDYKNHSRGNDFSYTLALGKGDITGWNKDTPETDLRHTNDSSKRRNIAFSYENYDETPFWDSLKLTVSSQKITQKARTDDYCDGGDNCVQFQNPAGLRLEGNTIVDKDGKEISPEVITTKRLWIDWADPNDPTNWITSSDIGLRDKNGNKYNALFEKVWQEKNKDIILDCSIWDCNGNFTLFDITERGDDKRVNGQFKIHLSRPNQWVKYGTQEVVNQDPQDNNYAKFIVSDIRDNGKSYKKISHTGAEFDHYYYTLFPKGSGFTQNTYKDRDLNTDVKDIRLDLTKSLSIKNIDLNLGYGVAYNISKKSMVNRTGVTSIKEKWYGWLYDNNGKICFGAFCPKTEPAESFLLPVKTKSGSLYFTNNTQINDWLGLNASYRYDRVSYKPEYIDGITPKLPSDMVRNMVVKTNAIFSEKEPVNPAPGGIMNFPGSYPEYQKAMKKYNEEKKAYEARKIVFENQVAEQNVKDNINYLASQKPKFSHSSYSLGATLDPQDWLRVQAKYSTGFRAPTSDEIYFTFKHPDFTIFPNTNLKPETARTKELAFTFYKNNSFITLSGFRTDYRNFIDLDFKGDRGYLKTGFQDLACADGQKGCHNYRTWQNINQDKAKVIGFEINTKLFLEELSTKLKGFNVGYKYTHQKGKVMGTAIRHIGGKDQKVTVEYPMNAIQPDKHIVSVGYIDPNDKFGLDLYWTHVSSKKAQDTVDTFDLAKQKANKYLSKGFDIFDVVGFYKPIKHLTLQAGIYNLFNKDYMTWENARSIRSFGTSNMVCQRGNVKSLGCNAADQGIERFHSPGRNFKLNVQYEF